jgi:hypothetical protein
VTVAGVACRGESPLHNIYLAFDISLGDGGRPIVRQRTFLEGEFSRIDYDRLQRTAGYCPVGQFFTKRSLDIEDKVNLLGVSGEGDRPEGVVLPERIDMPVFAPGVVTAGQLIDTREWKEEDGCRVLDMEGEVKVHIDCASEGSQRQRWGFLGGHSTGGWAPWPIIYVFGSLAASTLMTLRRLSDRLHIDPSTLRVNVQVMSARSPRGKLDAQDAAESGRVRRTHLLREVTARGISNVVSTAAIERAMKLDPMYGFCVRGDLLASDEIVVVAPSPKSSAIGTE